MNTQQQTNESQTVNSFASLLGLNVPTPSNVVTLSTPPSTVFDGLQEAFDKDTKQFDTNHPVVRGLLELTNTEGKTWHKCIPSKPSSTQAATSELSVPLIWLMLTNGFDLVGSEEEKLTVVNAMSLNDASKWRDLDIKWEIGNGMIHAILNNTSRKFPMGVQPPDVFVDCGVPQKVSTFDLVNLLAGDDEESALLKLVGNVYQVQPRESAATQLPVTIMYNTGGSKVGSDKNSGVYTYRRSDGLKLVVVYKHNEYNWFGFTRE